MFPRGHVVQLEDLAIKLSLILQEVHNFSYMILSASQIVFALPIYEG